ncbi:ATP-binding protein [Kineococcus sp. SYSU DK004]|uniref:ATP-binding protein n=1 Tax=Kineococcus sp. SYSU DK004 TaxID=3383125 RepID=UPI003D7F08F5
MDERAATPVDARVRLLRLPLRTRARLDRHVEGLLREFALVRISEARASAGTLPARLLEVAAELDTTWAPYREQRARAMDDALAAGEEFFDAEYATTTASAPWVRRLLAVLREADEFCRSTHLLALPADRELVAFRDWLFGQVLDQLAGGPARPWAGGAGAALEERLPAAAPASPATDGGEPVAEPLVLEPLPASVGAARRWLRGVLREVGAQELEDAAELAVSEVVTNAVLHARTRFTVAVRAPAGGSLRVEVTDSSPAPVRVRRHGSAATTGRGLRVVEAVSRDWGVREPPPGAGPGKTVWFAPRPS